MRMCMAYRIKDGISRGKVVLGPADVSGWPGPWVPVLVGRRHMRGMVRRDRLVACYLTHVPPKFSTAPKGSQFVGGPWKHWVGSSTFVK